MSAMTGLVDGLVARGLVERGQDAHDRRAVQLVITADGRALWGEAQATVLETTRQFLTPLTLDERERLTLALGDLERAFAQSTECEGSSGRTASVEERVPSEPPMVVGGR
jgi:DNA-binding MarR family transcriptional regulator